MILRFSISAQAIYTKKHKIRIQKNIKSYWTITRIPICALAFPRISTLYMILRFSTSAQAIRSTSENKDSVEDSAWNTGHCWKCCRIDTIRDQKLRDQKLKSKFTFLFENAELQILRNFALSSIGGECSLDFWGISPTPRSGIILQNYMWSE